MWTTKQKQKNIFVRKTLLTLTLSFWLYYGNTAVTANSQKKDTCSENQWMSHICNFRMAAKDQIPNQNAIWILPERDLALRSSLSIWREGHHSKFSLTFDGHSTRIMQFFGNRIKGKKGQPELLSNSGYEHSLRMYKEPPTGNITLEQFEEFAIDRLKGILREFYVS